jgi:tetratricopeptide (TPR) repeat protein
MAVCGVLLLAVGLVFGQTVRHAFVNYDDTVYVCGNPYVAAGLTAQGIAWAFTNRAIYWGPMTWLSFMLDDQLYGLNAGGYHLTNMLLHAATAILLFLVLRSMTGRLWPSALAAALFAIHPLRVESVAWVTERKDVLSGLFFMLTLGAYVHYVRHRFSFVRYGAVMVFFALGLMAKPTLIMLPPLLLLLDYWPLGRMGATSVEAPPAFGGREPKRLVAVARLVIEKLPLVALVAVCCTMFVSAQTTALSPNERFSWSWRIGNALISYVAYLGQSFYPVGLAVLYPRPGLDLPVARILGSGLVLLGITAAAVLERRRRPYLLVGWLWYLGTLAPVIGLVQFGIQAMADRFTYLTQIGLYIAVAWGMADVCRSSVSRRWAGSVASTLALAALMGCAWRQTTFWYNSETMWNRVLACTSDNFLAQTNLGQFLVAEGQLDEAIGHYRKALKIDPDYVYARYNLAFALARQGHLDEAIVHYQKGLERKPDEAGVHYALGLALAGRGRLDEAVAHYRRSLEIQPHDAETHYQLGMALAGQGRFDEAMANFHKALEIQPRHAMVHDALARLLATCPMASLRNGVEAIEHARQADQLYGGQPEILDTLAAAYAEAGRFPEALATARKAFELAMQTNKRALADALRTRIALYQAGKPFRQPPSSPASSSSKP